MNEINSNDIFSKWQRTLNKDNTTERYLYSEREDHIIHLVDMMKTSGVSFDDVKMYRNRVLDNLTTREGRKGVGRYKGWKENVLGDFDQILADTYITIESTSSSSISVESEFELDPFKVDWVEKKSKGNKYILKKVHEPNSLHFLEYLEDEFGEFLR